MSGSALPGDWADMTIVDGPFAALDAEQQARRQAAHDDNKRRLYLEDLRAVVLTPAGVHVLTTLLDGMGYAEPCWAPNASIHRQAAHRDMADKIFADLAAACPEAHDAIMRTLHLRRGAANINQKENGR